MGRRESRRRFLRQSGLALAMPALGSAGTAAWAGLHPARAQHPMAVQPDFHPQQARVLRRVAFGSCANQDKDQPIWDAVNAVEPDLFIFLGDNVYGDTRDMQVLQAKYAALAAKPGFRQLRDRTPIVAIWDDHDYGENDAGGEFPMKEESRRIFCDFWGEAVDSPRRSRSGIHASYRFGTDQRRVQVLLPDLRFNRTPLERRDLGDLDYDRWAARLEAAGRAVPGPYDRNPDRSASMLGDAQWRWLEAQLAVDAEVRILASSLQVAADFPGWEAWANYARDRERLIEAIRMQRADGLFCISGDTHWAECSRLDLNVPYPLWDITSSGLTETWPTVAPNANRVGAAWSERNFGLIDIDWRVDHAVLTFRILDEGGTTRLEQRLDTRELRQRSDC
jgi:alkaline phosphatase D